MTTLSSSKLQPLLAPKQLIATITALLINSSSSIAAGAAIQHPHLLQSPSLHEALSSYLPYLNPHIIHSILSSPSLQDHPSILLSFLNWAQSNSALSSRTPLPIPTLLSILSSLISHRRYNDVNALLHSHILSDHAHHHLHRHVLQLAAPLPELPKFLLQSFIVSYCRAGWPNLAAQIFKKMKTHKLRPSLCVFNTLLDSLVKKNPYSHCMHFVKELFDDAVKLGVSPDVITFGILINGYCLEGKLDEAAGLLRTMDREFKCKPNNYSYNPILNALCKKRMLFHSRDMLMEMKSLGILHDTATYNILVHEYCRRGWLKDAAEVIKMMRQENLTPNAWTYNMLINAQLKCCRFDEAFRLKDEMGQMELLPDVVTYNTLISGCFEAKRVYEAFKLVGEMRDKGVQPDVYTQTIIIKWYCEEGKMDEASEILRRMEETGLLPNCNTYYHLIKGYSKSGNLAEIQRIMKQMDVKGLKLDTVTQETALQNLCHEGKLKDACKAPSSENKRG